MTTTKAMLDKAAKLRAQAKIPPKVLLEQAEILEKAAALMNGDLTAKAQAALPQRLVAAIKTRRTATGRSTGESNSEKKQRRLEILTTSLSSGHSHSVRELRDVLAYHGESISISGVFGLVKQLPGLKKYGATTNRTYSLRAPKASPANGTNGTNGSGKLPILLDVLEQSGPMKIKELVAAVKATGYDGPLTGIHNYVKAGYIGRTHSGKYRFKKRPEPTAAAEPAAAAE
jgi:hypothetical protein